MSFQSITVLGNVGKQPEIRSLNSGDNVATFSIAVSEKRKGEDNTTWFNCIAFGKTAEVVQSYVNKGSKVLVQGRIQTREWTDKEGGKQRSWELVVDRLSLESPKESGSAVGGANTGYSGGDLDGDSIPFSMEWR
jgi:single-strand DNA-binding protein